MEKKTKEEILNEYTSWEGSGINCTVTMTPFRIMQAMQAYADQFKDERQKEPKHEAKWDEKTGTATYPYIPRSGEMKPLPPEAARHHQSPVAETPKEFLEKQGYCEFVTPPGQEMFSPTFQWATVIRLLSEYKPAHPSSLTGDAVEFANYLHNNRWMPLDGYDRWEQEESKSVTSTEQLYKLFLSRSDH